MLSKKIKLNLSEIAGMAAGINSIDNNKHIQLQLQTQYIRFNGWKFKQMLYDVSSDIRVMELISIVFLGQ
jgi:hypothetical protein